MDKGETDLSSTRGTTTWVALVALLTASIMIGGVFLFAVEDFFPTQGPRAGALGAVAAVIIVLFCIFVVIRQRRVRETEPKASDPESGPTEPESL